MAARTKRQVRAPRRRVTALAGVVALLAALGYVQSADATPSRPEHKVTLCHRTGSYNNPYVSITVDVASVLRQGHDHHDGPVFDPSMAKHHKWGDIIPPFDFGVGRTYPGKNWAAGHDIHELGCHARRTAPSSTTSTTSTTSHTTTTTTLPET